MKHLILILFLGASFSMQSQNAPATSSDKMLDEMALSIGTDNQLGSNITNDGIQDKEGLDFAFENSENSIIENGKIENKKRHNKTTQDKKAGKRIHVNPVYIIVGIVVVAVVIYFATSSRTTKM